MSEMQAYVERFAPVVALTQEAAIEISGRKLLAAMGDYDKAIDYGIALGQEELPVVHRFGPNLYIRETFIKAGLFVVGKKHKGETANFLLKGSVLLCTDDGQKRIDAPFYYVSPPGAKTLVALTDLIWQNIFSTDLTDLDEIENRFIEKNEVLSDYLDKVNLDAYEDNEVHRADYLSAIAEYGWTHDFVLALTLIENDRIDLPMNATRLAKSQIEGIGLFATSPFEAGAIIFPARINNMRTQAGRYVNHSKTPNARFEKQSNGDLMIVAIKRIPGCVGGNIGSEITMDYRVPMQWFKEDTMLIPHEVSP